MARLDRLGTAKSIAQLAATIGRQFSYELLQAVSPVDETTLQRELGRLVEAELVYQRGLLPQASYTFKHALIQDTAYQSLLRSTRQQYHQRIAQVLEGQFSDTAQTQPELLAYHYTAAELVEPAVKYWQRAGQQAIERAAYAEAITHLEKGLALLTALPEAIERHQRELTLRIMLGPVLMTLKGFAAPEVEQTYTRAHELCQQLNLDDSPQRLRVLYGLRRIYTHHGVLYKAQELSEQSLALAQRLDDFSMLLDAHYSLGVTLLGRGEFALGQSHLEQADRMAQRQASERSAVAFGRRGDDQGLTSLTLTTWSLWARGYPTQACQRSQDALTSAQKHTHPFTISFVFCQSAFLLQYRREVNATLERAETSLAFSTENGFLQLLAWGTILRGWALVMQGKREEGMTLMQQGLASALAAGSVAWRPYFLGLYAEVHGSVGQIEEGLRLMAEALALAEKTGEHFHIAELYRLKGELQLQQTSSEEAEAESCFHQALSIARRQQAKSWELRSATSLTRLWQSQGKRQEAHDLLAPVYEWFTEGFDTADLKEAQALITILS